MPGGLPACRADSSCTYSRYVDAVGDFSRPTASTASETTRAYRLARSDVMPGPAARLPVQTLRRRDRKMPTPAAMISRMIPSVTRVELLAVFPFAGSSRNS